MKKLLGILFCAFVFNAGAQVSLTPVPARVELFAPGVVSTNLYERDMALSPDGSEMFFTLQSNQGKFSSLVYLKKGSDGHWSKPELASFSGRFSDLEPAFTPDGMKLFFVSNRSLSGDSLKDFDIWQVEKRDGRWVNPKNIGSPVNTTENEFYPSPAANGNLYYTANYPGGVGKEDIWMAAWQQDHYAAPVCIDSAVNSSLYEFNAFVSPDERFILFTSYGRKDDKGRGDLYISRKDASDHWLPAKNLVTINSDRLDYCPFVSFDKKIFFFTSERSDLKEQFGPAPAQYKDLQKLYNGIMNGQGNIYWMAFDQIESARAPDKK